MNLKNCDLSFTKNTVYNDLRDLGGNAFRDIQISLGMGTASDLVFYLKKYSDLLSNYDGNEKSSYLLKGTFSKVYLIEDHDGRELVVKHSHNNWVPLQIARDIYLPIPRFLVKAFYHGYEIRPDTLERDVFDYEEVLQKYWGTKRTDINHKEFKPYLNMALYMVDHFLPDFSEDDLYSDTFWKDLLGKSDHKRLEDLTKYLHSIETPKRLIPKEERYILFDEFSGRLQTIFIQEAARGPKEIIPGKNMAYPFEIVSSGYIPNDMPKLMIEHILRAIECFRDQFEKGSETPKLPDFRPLDSYKTFPPTPPEVYFAETGNLVACKDKEEHLKVMLVDTHLLHEPEEDIAYRWVEKRCWSSLFLNLRFWVRKALEEF